MRLIVLMKEISFLTVDLLICPIKQSILASLPPSVPDYKDRLWNFELLRLCYSNIINVILLVGLDSSGGCILSYQQQL